MAQLRMLADDTEGAEKWGNRAIDLARAFGDVDTEVHALNNVGTALMIAGDPRGETILRESLDTALAHDQQEHVARAYTNLGATLVKHRRYAAGEDVLVAGIAFCADRDLDSWTSYMRGTLSILLLETGRWTEARSLAHAAATQSAATVSSVNALMVLGRLGTRTGTDPAAAAEAWRVAEPSGEPQRVLICAAGLAEAAWTRDDPDDVRRSVDAVWALAVERGGPWYLGELLWWLHCAGDTRSGSVTAQPVAEPFALMVAGDAAAAAAAWDAIGNPFWAALARAASGDPDDLRAATTGLEALGATATHAAVVRDLRRRRTPVPRGPRAGSRANPAGLTEREMEVLLALAEGLSNAEIAARFVLSEKTVAHHVSAVLRKLQEPSRSRAVATAQRTGLIGPV